MAEKLFVISNSHLDPVWIWRRRSGRSAWVNTMHSVIRMMKRHPELKFTCSSAAQYRWIEENEPSLFREIAKYVEQGRWEVVGGWEVQSDAIVSEAEPLLRQGLEGKAYFRRKFGIDVKTAYCVDSFGHGAGLPKLLNAVGLTRYVAMRPSPGEMPLPPLFDWKADDGSQVRFLHILDYYNASGFTEEQYAARIGRHILSPLKYQTLFFGVGDHGGGIYEQQMEWVKKASDRCEIVFATLEEYFEATANDPVPEVAGELGGCFRGCYSACHEVKRMIAQAVDRITVAEKLGADASSLEEPWRELLFQHFHDILPGTSIRDAYVGDVYPGIGGVIRSADELIDRALCRRAAAEDTSFMPEGGVFLRNPESHAIRAVVSVTGFADPNQHGVLFNALKDREGNTLPLQLLPPPTTFGPSGLPWGDLTAVVQLEPNEEKFLAYASEKQTLPNLGFARQRRLLEKLAFLMFADDHGTWGFTLTKYLHPEEEARFCSAEEVADGPVASILRAVWRVRSTEICAELYAYRDIPEIRISLRVNCQDPCKCLKMTFRHGIGGHTFATGGAAASVVRFRNGTVPTGLFCENGVFTGRIPNSCEVPMMDWCAAYSETSGRGAAFYASDLHGCDHADGLLRITLLRSVPFADHHPFPRNERTGFQEIGTSFFEVYLSEEEGMNERNLPKRARKRLHGAEVLEVTGHPADPDAYPAEEPYPLRNELENVVTESVRKNADGKREIHLMNYGDETFLPLPSGEKLHLPAKSCVLHTSPSGN